MLFGDLWQLSYGEVMLLLLNKASVVKIICRNVEKNTKYLPLEQLITMLPNTEVIRISSFNLLLFQVVASNIDNFN